MSYGILNLIRLLGSIALFLYGLKLMSESIQKLVGENMRYVLGSMTKNRFSGILSGLLIASIVQSSSATTVMVVSFVNTGLLGLTQAFGVIMGANIGTTATTWLISILGLKINTVFVSLPLIGIVFPLLFSRKARLNYTAQMFIGFALLFLGLDFLKASVPDIESNPGMYAFFQGFTGMGCASTFIFIAVGMVLTIILQSSSATIALTLVMCNNGWIGLPEGAALLMGGNIGTTIKANLAGITGNVNAKRAALSHTVFNILGVMVMLFVFNKYLHIIDTFLIAVGIDSAYSNCTSIPFALSVFHTSFSIINAFIWVWFADIILALTKLIIKDKKTAKESPKIDYLGKGYMQLPELSLIEAKNLMLKYCDISKRMFGFVKNLLHEKDEKESIQIFERIIKYEDITDKIEQEITTFLINISNKEVSVTAKEKTRRMRIISIEIEKVGDTCNKMAYLIKKIRDEKIIFSEAHSEHIEKMFLLIEEAFSVMFECINTENKKNLDKAFDIENRINEFRNILRNEQYENLEKPDFNFKSSFYANELCNSCEKIGDNIFVVNKVILKVTVE